MAIAGQFAGLDMKNLIGGPLAAAGEASMLLANTTADFINKVGFDDSGKLRTVAFGYQQRSVNEDGTSNLDELKVDIPMLAIVPIPNLQVDEVNILFDMEVRESETSQQSLDVGASLNASMNLGLFKVSITGSVSVHQENTRSSDNSAKYHVDVRATNHGTPEGLARVLDMMAANVAPALVGTTIKDGNGQDLAADAKARAEQKKRLRAEISQIETRLNAANNNLKESVAQLKRIATVQANVYSADANQYLNSLNKDSEEDTRKAEQYEQSYGQVAQTWTTLQNQAQNTIKMIADSSEGTPSEVSSLFALKALKLPQEGSEPSGEPVSPYGTGEAQYDAMLTAQNNAITAQRKVQGIEQELFDKKQEYNNVLSGLTDSASGGGVQNSGSTPPGGNAGGSTEAQTE